MTAAAVRGRWLKAARLLLFAPLGVILGAVAGAFAALLAAVALAIAWNLVGWAGQFLYEVFTPRDWSELGGTPRLLVDIASLVVVAGGVIYGARLAIGMALEDDG